MHPFKFKPNRIWRVYRGGAMIDNIRNEAATADGNYPEDWIASTVLANNPQIMKAGEGISTVMLDGREMPFSELVRNKPVELFGSAHMDQFGMDTGFLTKLLDSAVRLPLQAHPDRKTAKLIYGSPYGKTEAWIVLETREINGEEPYLIMGFNESLDEKNFSREALSGEFSGGLKMCHKHPVKPGNVLLIEGGMVHAIGPGVFLVEIMEPTDLVVQPELYCGTQRLSDQERFGKTDPETAMKVFDFQPMSRKEAWNRCVMIPKTIMKQADSRLIQLIDPGRTRYFGAAMLKLRDQFTYDNPFRRAAAGIAVRGDFVIHSDGKEFDINQGNTFFVPYEHGNLKFFGNADILFSMPGLAMEPTDNE